MAYENFTTYTEYDEGGTVTKTSSRVTGTNLNCSNTTAYVVSDKGASHFDGDFEHLCTIEITLVTWAAGYCGLWGMSDVVGDFYGCRTTGYVLSVGFTKSTNDYIRIYEGIAPSDTYFDLSSAISEDTPYYCKIKRNEAVGDNGTLYCYIYSDASRTTLVDTISIALHSKEDLQYIYALQTNDYGATITVSLWLEKLDLQEAAAVYNKRIGMPTRHTIHRSRYFRNLKLK